MRYPFVLLVFLAGCASDMQGKWPSLAPRAGESRSDAVVPAPGKCPGCGTEFVGAEVPPPPPPPPLPMPADAAQRLAAIAEVIAGVEGQVPAQARTASAAIAAAGRDPALLADAEVARSRYEALFLPLSVEERRLDVLGDEVAGRAGNDAMLAAIAALRARLAALQTARTALPETGLAP
jgi:hypothetical protein